MMTYVRVYKFDCCLRKNALDFLTNVPKDLHSFIFSGNLFQIFGPMYLIDVYSYVYDRHFKLLINNNQQKKVS